MSGPDELGSFNPGEILIEKYRVERVLGKGGMGVVVEATHLELDDRVAIKILRGDQLDDDGRARFIREARAAAKLKSEHIMRVVDVGTLDSGVPYMVMELLVGGDLATHLTDHGKLAAPHAVDLVLQACFGLAEAHTQGFVHRDIKPTNLFVTETPDGANIVKVLDFGISKLRDDVTLTSTRAVLGTPAYMAPEQWRSAKDADARSDLWSVGAVLYELVEGVRPFDAETVTEMCAQVMSDDPRAMQVATGGLAKVIMRCLEKEPDARFQSIAELARALIPFSADVHEAEELVGRIDRLFARRGESGRVRSNTPAPIASTEPATVLEPRARKPPESVARDAKTDPLPEGSKNPWVGGHSAEPPGATPEPPPADAAPKNPWFAAKPTKANAADKPADRASAVATPPANNQQAIDATDLAVDAGGGKVAAGSAIGAKAEHNGGAAGSKAAARSAGSGSRSRTLQLAIGAGMLAIGAIAILWIVRSHGASDSKQPAPPISVASGSGSSGSAGSAAVATTPVRGGTLRVATFRGDETAIALYSNSPTRSQHAMHLAIEKLVVLTPTGDRMPSVLAEVQPRHDGKEVVLTLRSGVMFHDGPCGGRAATGEDVKYSIQVARDKQQMDLPIDHIEVAGNDAILIMRIPTPLYSYALARVRLVPKGIETCEPDLQKMRHPIGTGAFRFVDSPNPDTVALAAVKNYWRKDEHGEPLPYVDRVELVAMTEPGAVLARMHQPPRDPGAIHMWAPDEKARTHLISTTNPPTLIGDAATPDLLLGTRTNAGRLGLWLLEVTNKKGPLADPRIRQAVALAIDRQSAIDKAGKAAMSPASPAGRFLRPGIIGFDPALTGYALDLDRANQLLADAGHPKGAKLDELVFAYSHSKASVDAVIASLDKLGIKARAEELPTSKQVTMAETTRYDALFVSRWIELRGNELIEIGELDRYRIGDTTKLLEQLVGGANRADREPVYTMVESQLLKALPTIPIARLDPDRVTYATIVTADVYGFQDRKTGYLSPEDALSYTDVWLADRP